MNESNLNLNRVVETRLKNISARMGVSGYFLAISVQGDRKYFTNQSASEADLRQTTFNVSCIIKPLIAAVTLQIAQRGELNLDSPIREYLPELPDSSVSHLMHVRHLMSHTAGYRGFQFFPPIINTDRHCDLALARIGSAPQLFWPGTVFNYDGSVTALLSCILSRATSKTARSLLCDEIFQPLGVNVLVKSVPRQSGSSSNQNAYTFKGSASADVDSNRPRLSFSLSIPDLMNFVEAIAQSNSGVSAPSLGLSQETVRTLQQHVVDIPRSADSAAAAFLPLGFTTGLAVYRNAFLGYEGVSGAQAIGFRLHSTHGIAIALGVNRPDRETRRAILNEVMDCVVTELEHPIPESRPSTIQACHYEVDEICGHYIGNHAWNIDIRPRKKQMTLTLQRGARLIFQKRFSLMSNGSMTFDNEGPNFYEPSFFRNPRTNELCLMFGMYAYKKVPTAAGLT